MYKLRKFVTDTGYFQNTLNQPSPACSIQHSDNGDLYQQIMQEVMLNAPTLTSSCYYPLTNDNNTFSQQNGKTCSPNRIHRRSYMLAVRQDSSRG